MVKNNEVGTKQSTAYIKKLIVDEARRQGVPEYLALAVAAHESGFNNIAVSRKNTDGSRDHGVFQLNDRYHKLRNVYDPIENIRYGIGMLRNGLKKNNGDVFKTLSDYNAGANATGKGRRQGNSYAQKVMNLFPTYGGSAVAKIANSNPEPTAQINKQGNLVGDTSTLEGKVSMNGQPTGAAANPLEAIETGYTTGQLADMGISPTSVAALQNNLQKQYMDYSRDLTPTEQMILNRQVALDPRVIMAADQQRTNALLQAQQNQLSNQQNMINYLNQAYDKYNQAVQNDYRLRNTGYKIDPRDIDVNNRARIGFALAGGNPQALPTAEQLAMQRYQSQIANQYGVPYEQYMAAMADIQANQQKALLQQAQDYITVAKNNGATDQEIIKQLGGSDMAKQLVENQKLQAQYLQGVSSPYMTGTGNLRERGLTGQNTVVGNAQTGAIDMAKAQLAASMGITVQQLENALGQYQADTQAATAMRGQDVGQETAKMQQAAKDLNAAANWYQSTSPFMTGYSRREAANIPYTLPQSARGVVVNPNLTAQEYQGLVNPQGVTQAPQMNTTNPFSWGNMMNSFQNRLRNVTQE